MAYLLDSLETILTKGIDNIHDAIARKGLGAVIVFTSMNTDTSGKLTSDVGT